MTNHKGSISVDIQKIIADAIALTDDGVGIYDENDILIYTNDKFAALFDTSANDAIGRTFSEIILSDFKNQNGVNIESSNIDEWLALAMQKRRSVPYRKFEVDKKSGHWFLVTEQIVNEKYLYVYITDITEKKNNALALEQLSLKLKKQASIDHLTNIYNRRYFYKMAKQEFSRCRRENSKAVVMMTDLDNFKNINDNYGHAAGDYAIQVFVKTVSQLLRSYDIFGRVGGEEFAILFPNTSLSEANIVAERIRHAVEGIHCRYQQYQINLTVSIGLSNDFHGNQTIDDVLNVADKHLLLAKSQGKNCTYSPK